MYGCDWKTNSKNYLTVCILFYKAVLSQIYLPSLNLCLFFFSEEGLYSQSLIRRNIDTQGFLLIQDALLIHNVENISNMGCFRYESSTNVRVLMLARKIHLLKSKYIPKKGLDGGIVEKQ